MNAWIIFRVLDCILLTLYILLRIRQITQKTIHKKRDLAA
jgi:hypothetical protein